MNLQLFRQASLKSLSSPEDLDHLIKISASKSWIALVALGLFFAAGLIWALKPSFPVVVRGRGTITTRVDQAVVLVSTIEAHRLRPGMEVDLLPAGIAREEFGYIIGTIATIGVHSQSDLRENEGSRQNSENPVTEVQVQLKRDSGTPNGFYWSGGKRPPVNIANGTAVSAEIVTDRIRPITVLLPSLRRIWE